MLPFICMSSQCQKDVAPTPTELWYYYAERRRRRRHLDFIR
jgi:hypothetical protein